MSSLKWWTVVDFGLFYLIDTVKDKKISIFLQIWTRKYVYIYIWNLTCTWSDTICPCQNIHRNAPGSQIKNFQNTFDRPWNEIRMKIQLENFFGILISTRLTVVFLLACRWFKLVFINSSLIFECRINLSYQENSDRDQWQ